MLKYNENIAKNRLKHMLKMNISISPYENLKNKILYYNDFVKKQDYIIKFSKFIYA